MFKELHLKFKKLRLKRNIAALRDGNEHVHQAAAKALGRIGDSRVVESLIAALRDGNEHVRRAVVEVLARIDRGWARGEAARRQVPGFIAALRGGNEHVRRAAAEALGWIGDARAVEPLIAALRDGNEHVHQAAAKALGRIGDSRAVEPLIALLRDSNENICQAVEASLEKIRQANQPLLPHYPNLFCQSCSLRVTLLEISSRFLKKEHFVVCRGCKSSLGLLPSDSER